MTYRQFTDDAHSRLFGAYLWQFKNVEFHLKTAGWLNQKTIDNLVLISPENLTYQFAVGADNLCNEYKIWKDNAPQTTESIELLMSQASAWSEEHRIAFDIKIDELAEKLNLKVYSLQYLKSIFTDTAGAQYGNTIGEVSYELAGGSSSLGKIIGSVLGGLIYLPFESPSQKAFKEFLDWYDTPLKYLSYTIDDTFNRCFCSAVDREFIFQ